MALTTPPSFSAEPPYYAVIFSSVRTKEDSAAYEAMADRMMALAGEQPGFLGAESVRDASGQGITVSYWESKEAITAWKEVAAHQTAQRLGRERWYEDFVIRICLVERSYGAGRGEGEG